MSFGNTTETDIMKWVYNSEIPAWASNTDFFLALHTANPAEAGDQTSSEANYTGYARVAMARDDTSAFTIANGAMTNALLTQLGICSAGSSTCTHWSIGVASSGASQIIEYGSLAVTLGVVPPIQPQFGIGDIDSSLD